jgi:hypothetical protein
VVDVRRVLVLGLLSSGCATAGTPPRPEQVGQVLTAVLSAEAEPMGLQSRAHQLRRQARREYQDGTAALADHAGGEATRLLERAQVDAELSLALARQDTWTQDLAERSAALRVRGIEPEATP